MGRKGTICGGVVVHIEVYCVSFGIKRSFFFYNINIPTGNCEIRLFCQGCIAPGGFLESRNVWAITSQAHHIILLYTFCMKIIDEVHAITNCKYNAENAHTHTRCKHDPSATRLRHPRGKQLSAFAEAGLYYGDGDVT